jgi:hypothetical protein
MSQKKSGRDKETWGRIFSGKMNVGSPTSGAKGGTTSKRESMKTVNHIKLNYQLFWLIIPAMLPGSLAEAFTHLNFSNLGDGASSNATLNTSTVLRTGQILNLIDFILEPS